MSQESGNTPGTQHPILHALLPEVDTTESVELRTEPPVPKKKPLSTFQPTERPTGGWWVRMWMELYLICYGQGTFICGIAHMLSLWLRHGLAPVARAVRRVWRRVVVRRWERLRFEIRRIRHGFTLAHERVIQAGRSHFLLGMLQVLALPFVAFRRHRRFASLVSQTVLVLGSVLVLTLVLRYWQNTTFALELVYGGERLGYIVDESVFKEAVDMAESRVIKNTDGYVIERESYLTLRPAQQSEVLTETELCDAILKMSGSEVEEMSGLYVDGEFEGALATRAEVERLLKEILSQYDQEVATANKKVEFQNHIEIVDGLYPKGSDEPYRALYKRLTATNEKGEPFLTVQIRCTEVYSEAIPFERRTVKDSTKYIGYSAIRTEGEEGERQITADVIYVNGVEQYREVLSTKVVKQPVTEVTVIGSYRANANAEAGVATGEFLWPLPSCRTLNSPFGYRWGKLHAGIDISGNGVFGKDIIASDGGVVTQVNASGWGGGYGLYVIIDHGNGYTTSYCHCNEILVSVGDKVTQGEVIAKVGNSGNSFGPHLHFEVRLNGRAVDPMPYLD